MNNGSKISTTSQSKSRLSNNYLRLVSVLIAIAAIGVLIYTLLIGFYEIPTITVIFFIVLSFFPQFWHWIEYVFSKQPSSKWGRFVLNLVLAILLASIFEDILELLVKIAKKIIGVLS